MSHILVQALGLLQGVGRCRGAIVSAMVTIVIYPGVCLPMSSLTATTKENRCEHGLPTARHQDEQN
eukprot:5388244-Amphidinium_carterae.1